MRGNFERELCGGNLGARGSYRLVWAIELLLAATGTIDGSTVLGYFFYFFESIDIPIPTFIGGFLSL